MKLDNIVWTAVASLGLGLGSLLSAFQDSPSLSLAFGLTSIASAVLSSREKR
jgi:hypothetical protein